jgi:hypothetical protein
MAITSGHSVMMQWEHHYQYALILFLTIVDYAHESC